ncbi:MAG: branched-chain amino acid ABC transporter permease [Oscillospiraceae bacterium]|jgi:branched-chain amino acid transport system permease protein|nr:branched-chain amino acid ABC transporter permease [Clostridiales bacterium]MBS1434258.1 branched-chain amino acid ABC transporter permease [Oscillospiraceae bacterium]
MNLTPYLIRGLATGGQFALVAIGYTMVYGILKLINFAHGDLFMLSGIMMIYLAASFPTMPMWVTILIMIALTVFVGFAIEKCAYSPLRTAPRMSVMISAIGVSYLLQNLVCYVTGGLAKQFPDIPLISQSVRVFGVKDKLAVFISPLVAVVLMVILVLIINHTKFGMSMRAVSKDFETAQLMGVKINRVISMTFIIGSFLAAVGALLYFAKNTGINHMAGSTPGIKAFIAAVVGGIGSVPGAVVGALLIGVVESLAKAFGLADFSDVISFALLIIILVIKPTGLFGEKTTEKV